MNKRERANRVVPYGFLYLIDKSILLTKADLFIKILNNEDYMHWIVWVEIVSKDFFEMVENLEQGQSKIKGTIYTHIPNYSNALGTEVILYFNLNNEITLPQVDILNCDTEIGKDFKNGISFGKIVKWTQNIYHPNLE